MFIGHNYDKESSYLKSLKRGRGKLHGFWERLLSYIYAAGLTPEQCFFTNALMGLQPKIATGKMKATPLFREQCRTFIRRQVEIVKPRRLAILGKDARKEVVHSNTEVQVPGGAYPTCRALARWLERADPFARDWPVQNASRPHNAMSASDGEA